MIGIRPSKRYRTNFTSEQLIELENVFQTNHYIARENHIEVAERLKLNVSQVKVWFQNRRMKEKRDHFVNPDDFESIQSESFSPSESQSSSASTSSHCSRSPDHSEHLNNQMSNQPTHQIHMQFIPNQSSTVQTSNTIHCPTRYEVPSLQQTVASEFSERIEHITITEKELEEYAEVYRFELVDDENQITTSELPASEFDCDELQPTYPNYFIHEHQSDMWLSNLIEDYNKVLNENIFNKSSDDNPDTQNEYQQNTPSRIYMVVKRALVV